MEEFIDHHAVNAGVACPDCGRQWLYIVVKQIVAEQRNWEEVVEFDVRKAPKLICPCGWSLWGTFNPSGTYSFARSALES